MADPTPYSSSTPNSPAKTKSRQSRRWMLLAEIILLLGVLTWVGYSLLGTDGAPKEAASLKVQLRDSHETVYLFREKKHENANEKADEKTDENSAENSAEKTGHRAGEYTFRVSRLTGPPMDLTPDQFAARIYQDQQSRGLMAKILNITSPTGFIWVGLGLLGQVLFTGRMIVQWLASEKSHRSVVPPAFWWMSLIGATMLLLYFIWRKDAVGVLGQSVGWFIYVRNLWLIYQHEPPQQNESATEAPAAAAEKTAASAGE